MPKYYDWKPNEGQRSKTPFIIGERMVETHPLFGLGCCAVWFATHKPHLLSKEGVCAVEGPGEIAVNDKMNLEPNQWSYSLAHCLLHMVFGHLDRDNIPIENGKFDQALWNKACDIYVTRFLYDIKFGDPTCPDPALEYKIKLNDEHKIYAHLKYIGEDGAVNPYGTNANAPDMLGLNRPIVYKKGQSNRFAKDFTEALNRSVNDAISAAGGHSWKEKSETPIKKASEWFLTHYPLLGGLAASFKIIEDPDLCINNEIHIAAVDPVQGEIYCNPTANLTTEEWRFVLAHEYLHAGLMHHKRCAGRDNYLWNVACDYCVNSWLVEMEIGSMPSDGLLYDKELQGLSAEAIYDIII